METTVQPDRVPIGRTASRARLLTLVWLASSAISILLLPLVGIGRETSPVVRTAGVIGIAVFFVTTSGAIWAAVTPWISGRVHRRAQTAFALSALASVPLVAPVASGDWATWAWLGAAVVGVSPLLWRWPLAVVASLLAVATSVSVARLGGGSVADHLITTAGVGAMLAVVNWAPVWLWELFVRAEASQVSAAQVAAADERLRFARDVHDVLGHDLTVIALKCELAARTAMTDPQTAARESAEARRLAESALDKVRSTAAGYRETDLPAELAQIADLLATAGVRCDLDVQPVDLSPVAASVLAAVAKEATTNVLRHSSARSCHITLSPADTGVTLVVANDGARPRPDDASSPGSGLVGMRARLAPLDGVVSTERHDDAFTLRAAVPSRP